MRYTFYMTRQATIFLIILIILILGGLGIYLARRANITVPVTVTYTYQTPYSTPTSTTTPPIATSTTNSMIRVTTPVANALVKSPLTIKGEARGNWYFEASFPIKVLDATGKVLGVIPAQAQGDWMTTQFVPFQAILSFATSTTLTGTIVLEKDNPSDLPANAASVRIPVRFR